MTSKSFKDRCAVHEKYGVENQAGRSKPLHELTNSMPVTSVLVEDKASIKLLSDIIARELHRPQHSLVRIGLLEPIPVSTAATAHGRGH